MIRNQWYAILPSARVPGAGIVAVRRMGLDLALFRDQMGRLNCVADQCSHRGAALSLGKTTGDCIKCPFHGLEFAGDGSCRLIPANGRAATEDLSRYRVRSYTVREAHDIIYLWYGDEAAVTPDLPFFDDQVDESFVWSEIEDHWTTHYSRCIENQLDVVHLPFVHHNTIGRGNKTLVHGPKVVYDRGELRTSATNEVDRGQRQRTAQECRINPTYLSFRFPNLWLNHISPVMKIIIYFAPVDDGNTILYIRFYTKVSRSRLVNRTIAWFGRFGNDLVQRQDRRIVITQRPKTTTLRSGEKLLRGDGPILRYRQIRDQLQRQADHQSPDPLDPADHREVSS